MHFLPDVYVTCDACKGRRYNRETLDVHYKGKNIHDVLEMTVEEAMGFFRHIPPLAPKLATLVDVGLGYVSLGQSALTPVRGEAQRVKLSLELSRKSTGQHVFILDEPTTGLHFADVKKLLEVLQKLVEPGTPSSSSSTTWTSSGAPTGSSTWTRGGDGGGCVVASGTAGTGGPGRRLMDGQVPETRPEKGMIAALVALLLLAVSPGASAQGPGTPPVPVPAPGAGAASSRDARSRTRGGKGPALCRGAPRGDARQGHRLGQLLRAGHVVR